MFRCITWILSCVKLTKLLWDLGDDRERVQCDVEHKSFHAKKLLKSFPISNAAHNFFDWIQNTETKLIPIRWIRFQSQSRSLSLSQFHDAFVLYLRASFQSIFRYYCYGMRNKILCTRFTEIAIILCID